MKTLLVSGGAFALVDDDDWDRVSQFSWSLRAGYVKRTDRSGPRATTMTLHRFILNAPRGVAVDHIDRERLNNQKHNLRFATPGQNSANRAKGRAETSSKYKGVNWHVGHGMWAASIRFGRRIHLGYFDQEEAAGRAYDAAAVAFFKEFALPNFPGDVAPFGSAPSRARITVDLGSSQYSLPPGQAKILNTLKRNVGCPVPWGDLHSDRRTVTTQIANIRREVRGSAWQISNIPDFGFMLVSVGDPQPGRRVPA